MIDDNVERITKASNYIARISHGQFRMEGSIKQVIPLFKDHERDRNSLKTDDEKKNFDLDWKENRTRTPELTYNFKRVDRYNHVKPPVVLVRIWIWVSIFILGMVLTALLMFNDIGKIKIGQNEDQASIQNQSENPYEEKLAYGIVLDDSIKLENMESDKVTGDKESYKCSKKDIRYFDLAGLFEEHSGKSLATFMSNNYSNYYEFYNSHLHKKHSTVTDSLVPDAGGNNRFIVPITQQPITMIFNDQNKLAGFTIPMKDKEKLKNKFNIDNNFWI